MHLNIQDVVQALLILSLVKQGSVSTHKETTRSLLKTGNIQLRLQGLNTPQVGTFNRVNPIAYLFVL